MTYNLLYLDDNPVAKTIADGFNTTGYLKVIIVKPTFFEEQIIELINRQSEYQGLILDLRLDEDLSGDRKAHYTATSLAQQIRSKVSEGAWIHEFPIILFTTQENIEKLYSSDVTSHDLFDISFIKDKISDPVIQYKIHSIIEAYKAIESQKPNLEKILNIESLNNIDKRIFSAKYLSGEGVTVYSYARFILKELIFANGPLIDENYLAARLGIDYHKSNDWDKLKSDFLSSSKYSGVFSGAWNRWWMYKLNQWWESSIAKDSLASLDARERVELLKEKLILKELVVAEPLPKAASYRYWTVCQGYRRPIDPREGLRIDGKDPLPWQETMYMSVEAALERIGRDTGLKIHPLEKERFNQIKKQFA